MIEIVEPSQSRSSISDIAKFRQVRASLRTAWIEANFDFPHKGWCLIWPFSRKGGGYVSVGDEHILVHRIMCEHKNGLAPSPEHHAGHTCGRGKEGCVNQHHLEWQTPSKNQLERFEHEGCVHPRYRLTPEKVQQIRALKGLATLDAIAEQFGISMSNVSLILAGKTWKNNPKRIFTRDEVDQIRRDRRTLKQLAAEFGVSESIIHRVRSLQTYRYFDQQAQCDKP